MRRDDLADHPRVARPWPTAATWPCSPTTSAGVIGRGLVGRCELSVELFDPESAPPGAGRRLLAGALRALPADEPVWAQVAAGNARSLRAFLAAGFVPVASEVLLVRDR